MRSVFHWLAKAVRNSRLQREIFSSVQTKPVESGGAGLPPLMIGAALEHKFVADDVELGTMLKNTEVFRLLMETELDNPSFGYHGTQGAAAKKTKFRNAVHQFIADVPALKLIQSVLEKAARCGYDVGGLGLSCPLSSATTTFPRRPPCQNLQRHLERRHSDDRPRAAFDPFAATAVCFEPG